MTDIVERLRAPARLSDKLGGKLPRSILDEAADEIERLRAAVMAEREACMAAINAYIKQGELPEPAHSERNGMIITYNLLAARSVSNSKT